MIVDVPDAEIRGGPVLGHSRTAYGQHENKNKNPTLGIHHDLLFELIRSKNNLAALSVSHGAQCSPSARARKVAICARVTGWVGRKVPSGKPVVISEAARASMY